MKNLSEDIKYFLNCKIYCFIVCLTAAGSYGFKISHITIGIDDTCVPLYFTEGLAPAVGRWTLFLINKLFHISEFNPWLTDLAGVLLLLLSSVLWCALLRRVFADKVSDLGYALFAAMFISCPLISEVYVYYLHNGIGLGYGFTAVALLFLLDSLKNISDRKRCGVNMMGTALFLTVAVGCYESFMMVYIIGVVLLFIAVGMVSEKGENIKIYQWGILSISPMFIAMLFRSIVIRFVCAIFQVSIPENFFVESRGTITVFGGGTTELLMYFKRYWVKYCLNFFAYLPITVLVLATATLFVTCMVQGIKKKNFRLPLAAVAIPILPALMIFVEGKESYYRAGQYVPLMGAFAVFLLVWKGQDHLPIWGKRIGIFAIAALLWNQCAEMNHWFYVDHLKYEYFNDVMTKVNYDLKGGYDLSKPVIFRGAHNVPNSITEGARLSFDSTEYRIIKSLGDMVDEHLIEKYNAPDGTGYVIVETPVASTLQWGVTAFDGTAREIRNFMLMHGYEVTIETDLSKIDEAEKLKDDMPKFPKEGYIQEFEEYIIINL